MYRMCTFFALLFLLGCNTDEPPAECSEPAIFDGSSDGRVEQLSRPAAETSVRVELLPEDAGRRLRIYPTTSSDVWAPGGSLTFERADGSEIYGAQDLCPADFYEQVWTVPDSAVAVVLELPTDVIATVLFTLVIGR